MTREKAAKILKEHRERKFKHTFYTLNEYQAATDMAIKALEQEPCEDCISRQAVLDLCDSKDPEYKVRHFKEDVECLPPVIQQQKIGRCKDCQYFRYDDVAMVDGIPLIVAHEICTTWGNGCKTRENGYCFMYTPKMQEVEE